MGLGAINFENINIGSVFEGFGKMVGSIGDMIRGHTVLDENKMQELRLKWAELEQKRAEMEQALMLAQIEINKIEAASASLFKGGWRPATAWLCVAGLGWQIFVWPIWVWVSKLATVPLPPDIDTAVLITLLIGMLGLGTLRTVEKKANVESK
jgi:hypothetical protein